MIQALLAKLGSLKLTLIQYFLIIGAGVIAVLAIVLKTKQHELTQAKVALLKSHYDNETERTAAALAVSAAKVKTSKERYEDSLNHLNRLGGS